MDEVCAGVCRFALHKRNIRERCHTVNHSLAYVNEENINRNELNMYDTGDYFSVEVLKITRYDGKMNIR